MVHFARLAAAYRDDDRVAFTAVIILDAHPSFQPIHDENRREILRGLHEAGVRVLWDVPREGAATGELGLAAAELCAWPSRAQWISPAGVVKEESPPQNFPTSLIRGWTVSAAGGPGAKYWIDLWLERGKARTLYWLYALGLIDDERNDCAGACPIRGAAG